MTGNVLTPQSPISLKYWEMLKNLSDTVKMELVALLSSSIVNKEVKEPELTEEEKDREFWSLCGCWKDDPEDAARSRSEGQVIDLSIKESKTYPSNLLTINFIQPKNPSDSV